MEDNYNRENRIREALNLRGMKQVELCEKTGLNKSALNSWISQRWQPKQDALYKMAKVLGVSEMWLAGYDVEMDRPVEQLNNDTLSSVLSELRKNRKLLETVDLLTSLDDKQLDLIISMTKEIRR